MKIRLFAALLMILALGNACTKKFEKINTDPSLITSDIIKPSMLFTSVLVNSVFETYNASIFWEYANYYSNQASGTIFQNRDWSAPFSDYQGNLINMAEVVRLTAKNSALINENSMARIWKVWLFQQLTDAYGDLPYSQSVLSVDSVINQPAYDTQQAIYISMLNELKDAVAKLNPDPSLSSFGSADLLFGGNISNWARFGNSLRLRLAIRIRYADAALAKQHISDVISQPLIDNNSLNVFLTTLAGDPNLSNQNPLYQGTLNGAGNSYYIGLTVTQELLKRNDPRLPIYAIPAPAPGAGYRGRPMCLIGDQKTRYGLDSVATLSNVFLSQAYPINVMNAAEVYFIRAEAALAGLSSENAGQLYRKGISAALSQYKVPSSDSANYLNSTASTLSGVTQEGDLENIIVQKYLAIMNQGTEAWAEWRRTGYPKIWTGGDLGSTNGNIPRRLTYPLSEYTLNNKNVTAAVSRLAGGDQMLSRFWWDAKPGLPFSHPRQGSFPPEIY